MEDKELIELAFKASENALCTYSHYHVGAALLCSDGKVFLGANIENASYGATNCAERSALFAAYSNGYRKKDLVKMACVTHGKGYPGLSCGICRQVMADLCNHDMPVIFANDANVVVKTVLEMLPEPFCSENIEDGI